MKRIFIFLAMVACSGFVSAALTTYTSTYHFGCDGIIWDSESHSWAQWLVGSNPTVTWSHQLPDEVLSSQLFSADLTIRGMGIENILGDWDGDDSKEQDDFIQVLMNGTLLGVLGGNVTTFSLDPSLLSNSNLCSATLTFVYDRKTTDCLWPVDTAMLCMSELQVSFDNAASLPPSVVPAPGAVGLAGIGIVFVGWLRTRKTV